MPATRSAMEVPTFTGGPSGNPVRSMSRIEDIDQACNPISHGHAGLGQRVDCIPVTGLRGLLDDRNRKRSVLLVDQRWNQTAPLVFQTRLHTSDNGILICISFPTAKISTMTWHLKGFGHNGCVSDFARIA